jgi:uncharacterized membrane-anchored protein
MAKKKKKEEKEEAYEWTPPEFDEKAFLLKDITSTKAVMLTAGVALVFGVLAFAAGHFIGVAGGLVAYLVGAVLLKYIYKWFKLDPEAVDNKLLAGNILMYMLLALGVWILLMNKPFV